MGPQQVAGHFSEGDLARFRPGCKAFQQCRVRNASGTGTPVPTIPAAGFVQGSFNSAARYRFHNCFWSQHPRFSPFVVASAVGAPAGRANRPNGSNDQRSSSLKPATSGSGVALSRESMPLRSGVQEPITERARKQGEDWRHELVSALAEAEGFAEMTIRAKVASAQQWHTITVRPISLRGSRHLQVTTFTARQSTTANHPAPVGDVTATDAVAGPLLAAAGLGSVSLRTAKQDLAVQITKRGKGIVHRTSPQNRPALVSLDADRLLSHDRAKDTPIPADQPHPFLQKIGFQTADGRIKAHMQDKFSQVNEFLKLLGHTGIVRDLVNARTDARAGAAAAATSPAEPRADGPASTSTQAVSNDNASAATSASSDSASSSASPAGSSSSSSSSGTPLHILDCGCGSSHLSFGTYHYLNHVLSVPATLGGVDVNAQLIARANDNAAQMGLRGVRFDTAPIGDYRPPTPPDIVLALHACDTATDDALALAVKQASPLIMAVPCCHAHLHKQLSGRPPSSRPPWAPLLRHGILRQRQLDLLTDTLRTQLLRVAGYRTDVVEFVSTEHTPRNLLIRAVRQPQQRPGPSEPVAASTADSGPECGGIVDADGDARGSSSVGRSWSRQQLAAAREYLALRDYWQVVPRLEVLLNEELGPVLLAAAAAAGAGGEAAADADGFGSDAEDDVGGV